MRQSSPNSRPRVGVDIGATLAKLAIRSPEGDLTFELLDALDPERVLEKIHQLAPKEPLGLTGCGAENLAKRSGLENRLSLEFEAWGKGANVLLGGESNEALASYLLVSLGTGTSMLRVEGEQLLQSLSLRNLHTASETRRAWTAMPNALLGGINIS